MSDVIDRPKTNDVGGVAVDRLRAIIQRVERLEQEKKGIADDIKDELANAKSDGFNVKAIRRVLSLRKLDKDTRDSEEHDVAAYLMAVENV